MEHVENSSTESPRQPWSTPELRSALAETTEAGGFLAGDGGLSELITGTGPS